MNWDELDARTVAYEVARRHEWTPGLHNHAAGIRSWVNPLLREFEGAPGATWQERWVAANMDLFVRDRVLNRTSYTLYEIDVARLGLRALAREGVVRPGLDLTLTVIGARITSDDVCEAHAEEVGRAVKWAMDRNMVGGDAQLKMARYAFAALIQFAGKPLSAIPADVWKSAALQRRDMYRGRTGDGRSNRLSSDPEALRASRLIILTAAYGWAVGAGLVLPMSTPERGKPAVPTSMERLLALSEEYDVLFDTHGRHIPPRVRAALFDVFQFAGGAWDHSTLRGHVVRMSTFFQAVHAILPGHDSLHIPLEYCDAVFDRVKLRRNNDGTVAAREDTGTLLNGVRALYDACAECFADQPAMFAAHADVIEDAKFPYHRQVLRSLNDNEMSARRARLQARVEELYPHLDAMTRSALDHIDHAARLVNAAHGAGPGSSFTVDGFDYYRARKDFQPTNGMAPQPKVAPGDGTASTFIGVRPVRQLALRMHRNATLFLVLRHAGLRIEEAAELNVESLTTMSDPATGIVVPALRLARPSKLDKERTVPLHPDAFRALETLVEDTIAEYGEYPLVTRYDWHEDEDQKPSRLLFLSTGRHELRGPSHTALVGMLQSVIKWHNEHDPAHAVPLFAPHMLRRLFATDLYRTGGRPSLVQRFLGHQNLQTTLTYVYANEDEDVQSFLSVMDGATAREPIRKHER